MSNNNTNHHIRYDLLVQKAMRGVIRDILAQVRDEGLPAEHHFYIVFNTNAPGVNISSRLRQQYPEEMTIVIQHQYWGFEVKKSHFMVKLSFNGITEPLVIPYNAIKAFVDPSVPYGFQLTPIDNEPYIEDNTDVIYEGDTDLDLDQSIIDNAILQDLLEDQDLEAIMQNNSSGDKTIATIHMNDGSISHPPKISVVKTATSTDTSSHRDTKKDKSEEGSSKVVSLDAFRKKS